VTHKFYPGGRLNEINHKEVTRDLIAWLHGVVAKSQVVPAERHRSG
jgi:hypothetical protein